jgi:hypothetical protein
MVKIGQPVEGGTAGVHSPRHFDLGQTFLAHGDLNLACHDSVDGGRADLPAQALLTKPAIES